MGNKQIDVDSTKIREAKQKIVNAAATYTASYEKIYECIDDIASAGAYIGDDAIAFNEKINGFKNDFSDLENKLSDYCRFLEKAAETYEFAQNDVTGRAKKLKSNRK